VSAEGGFHDRLGRHVRVVVIEDDERIADFVARGLGADLHSVQVATTGERGLALAADPDVELVILDLSLPDIDGTAVLDRLRGSGVPIPILVLTARDSTSEKVRILDAGASDYMTKPFALDELLARVRVLARRAEHPSSASLRCGDLVLDLRTRRVTRADLPVKLTNREYALLAYLMQHPEQVLTRVQILAAVWDVDFDPHSNVVDVYVRYLRAKIDPPTGPSLIESIRGTGYRFTDASRES
jgi:DNA-binding response OmpR family regulator